MANYYTCLMLTSHVRLFTLRRKQQLDEANITHVLSVLRLPLDQDLFKPFKHLVVEVDDVEDENLLQYFVTTNGFIQEGLDSGGGVLVHWLVHLGSSPFLISITPRSVSLITGSFLDGDGPVVDSLG